MFRRVAIIICFLFPAVLVSCGPDKPPAADRPDLHPVATSANPSNPTKPVNSASDMPIPPKDAQYTIYCQSLAGPDHIERARQLQQVLRQATAMKDWYIVHGGEQSTLYYGFYRTVDPRDPQDDREGKRAIADLNKIRAMVDTNGFRPFSASVPVPIDAPDPAANSAWDLTRTGQYWSVEIAVYKGSPERKQAAVDAVRDARSRGIEAYYYHGPTASSVCIGAWPRDAAREIDPSMQNDDPNTPLYVTPQPLNADANEQVNQQGMKNIAPHVDPIDPTLIDVLHRFPDHALNGDVLGHKVADPVTKQTHIEPDHSFLVKIPLPESTDEMAGSMNQGAAPAAPVQDPNPAPAPGAGRLKSIGE